MVLHTILFRTKTGLRADINVCPNIFKKGVTMKRKSSQRDRIINRINDRIKALKSKGYEAYANLGEKIVNARIKFGATLTDTGRISKKSIATLKQLKAIEKMIPTTTRVKLKLEVTYQRQPAKYKQNVSFETFKEQALEIADFFEKIEFFYADNLSLIHI